jgi:hypothetical protein
LFFVAASLCATLVAERPALAKGGWQYFDPECPVAVGPKSMKFVATQPKVNIERVCDALIEAGPAVLVLETRDGELIDMIWDIRVVRDEGQADFANVSEAATVARLPPTKYKNGMVNFDVTFAEPGKYLLLIEAASDDGAKKYLGRHPFTAGLFEPAEIYGFVAVGALALVGGALFYLQRRKTAAA